MDVLATLWDNFVNSLLADARDWARHANEPDPWCDCDGAHKCERHSD